MRNKFVYYIVFVGALLLDRVTKFCAYSYVKGETVHVYNYLDLHFSWNRGVSWGLFGGTSRLGFILLTAFIATVIAFFLLYTVGEYRKKKNVLFETLVLAGAVSNFFDRIYYGAVIDFIDIHIGSFYWPTFNVADACIVLGVGGILFGYLRQEYYG